jgi:hypothetical protein
MTRAQDLLDIWAWASLIGGPLLILLGARAAGVGILASLPGSFVGALVVPDFDLLPHGASIGATTALVVSGLIGLFWKSPVKRTTLVFLGGLVAVLGGRRWHSHPG